MKNKIFIFIVGVLVGAILATGVFFIYEKNLEKELKSAITNDSVSEAEEDMMDFMNNGEVPPPKPEGDEGGEPPVKPAE